MTYFDYEKTLLGYMDNLKNQLAVRPLNLGGIAGSGGGAGGGYGGYVGYLPQTRVAYDLSELASSSVPTVSGSLLDNLNHIRYRIQVLETSGVAGSGVVGSGGAALAVESNGVTIDSAVTVVNFEGASVSHPATGEVKVSPIFPEVTSPVSGDFTWVNQGTATLTQLSYGLELSAPASAGTDVHLLYKAAPSTPYSITAGFFAFLGETNYPYCGIGFRESSTGKLVLFGLTYINNVLYLELDKYTDENNYSAAYTAATLLDDIYTYRPWFLRITDDGSNRKVYSSPDGRNFRQLHSVGRTDFLTANQVFFFANSENTNYANVLTLFSWKQT